MKIKKLFTLVLGLLLSVSLFSQNYKDISNLFSASSNLKFRNKDFVSDAIYLKLNTKELAEFYRDGEETIELSLPISETENVDMELTNFKVLTDDFLLKTSNGETISDYKRGKFFRGELKNKKGFATISFFKDEIAGIISIEELGNFNLGKIKNSHNEYIIYGDKNVKIDLGIVCNTTDEYDMGNYKIRIKNKIKLRDDCVKFYLEGDYALYQDKSTISNTADYMTSLFAEMATLYSNEQIDIEIKEIMIWTSPDGYSTSSSSTALDQFIANNPDKNADLCHLFALGGNNTGGLAYTDVLCNDTYKFAYSNISSTYENVPTYSWSVECITHETGHNFGSKHTHDCVWGPNDNEQIDDCGPEAGYPGSPGDCYDSNDPQLPDKGTIMSYCHLIGSIGIDFNLGFGQEPGDLIRSKYANAACLTACEASSTCDIPVNLEVTNITGTSATLDWEIGASGSKWEVEYGDVGFSLGSGNNTSNITNTYLNVSGLDVAKSYDWYIRTDCDGGDYSNWVGPKTFTTVCTGASNTTLPFIENWENDNGTLKNDGYISCDSDKNWYFETTAQGEGRVQYGTDCNWQITGSGSLLLDRTPNGVQTTNHAILTIDLSSYASSNDLELRFKYKDLGDESHEEDKVSIRGDDSESWIDAYDLDPGSQTDGNDNQVILDLDALLFVESQSPGSSFQIRLGQRDNYSSPSDGIVFDDIEVIDCNDNIETVPYETDFSGAIECWSIEDIDKDNYTWKISTGSDCDQDYFGLEYEGSTSPSTDMNDWLYSPGLQLTGGASYRIGFSVGDQGSTEKLEVYLSAENSSTDAPNGTLLFRDESIDNLQCKQSLIDFVAPSTGVFYICFHGYSDDNSHHNLYLDDFKIDDSPSSSSLIVESNTNNTCDEYSIDGVAGNSWHNIYSNNKIIAAINPNGQTLGTVSVYMRDGGAVETYNINGNDVKTIPRYFNFESENSFANDVTVRLYLLDAELNEYNVTAPTSSDAITDLQINHYDGDNENCNWADNSGSGNTIVQSNITTGSANTNDYFMEINVNSFSEFLIRQDGNSNLPLEYDFDAKKAGKTNILTWNIYDYINLEKIIIQKGEDLEIWEELKIIEKQNINVNEYIDKNPFDLTYYRILFIDQDGTKTYSSIKSVVNSSEPFILKKIFPNPSKGIITLDLKIKQHAQISIEVRNLLTQLVYSEIIEETDNTSMIKNINLKPLDKGLYFISLQQGTTTIVKKLIIE